MNEWYNTTELAKLELPGLPATKRGIDKLVKRQNWPSRIRQASGGGLEYPITALPVDAQAALLAREAPPPVPVPLPAPPPPKPERAFDPLVKAAGDAAAAQLQGRAQQRLNDRLTLLDSMAGQTGNDLLTAVVRYNTGELNVPAEIRARIPRVSVATIHRWRAQIQWAGLVRVAGQFGNRKGSGLIDTQPQLAVALRGLLVEYPHVRPGFATEFLAVRYQNSGLTLPLPMTIRRWLAHWKAEHAELYCRLRDPDAWKSRYMMGVGDASAGILRLNQEWQFDSTPADLLLVGGRHSLIGVIDVYSRRVALHVSKTSKAAAIAALFRKVLLAWGVPEKVKTDNGQDYVSQHIVRILQALSIEHEKSAPFSPWQKPHIERLFRTFLHDLVELLPGYIGHNVAEREQLRARQQFSDRLFVKNSTVELPGLSAEDLQAFCDRWCAAYHTRPHSGLAGQSPLIKAAAWREPLRAISDERILDLLLAPAPGDGWRTVSKSNGIQIDGYDYLAGALGLYSRQRVRVLYDPEGDMGQVWCFDAKGNFIAVAECPELRNLNRQAIAAVIKANQLQKIREEAKTARAEAKTLNLKTAVEEVQAARDAAAATLVAFPAPTVPYVTPHITGAETALRGDDALGPDGPTPELLKAIGYVTAPEPNPVPAPVIPLPRSYNSHSERVRDIYARAIAHGLEPDADDLIILHEYYDDPAGRAGSQRLDALLRKLYPAVDLAALKRRWLGLTIAMTAQQA